MINLISEADMTIVKSGLIEKHPELFHYTRAAGFDAIIASQEIWATHFENLNDTTEVYLLREPLKAGLTKRFSRIIEERQKRSFSFSAKVLDHGGRQKVSAGMAEDFSKALYKVTYGGGATLQFGAPYITSFSTPTTKYDAEHGVLSQWRDYGKGGYCLVFDTATLAEMLWTDFEQSYFVHLNIDEVVYALEEFDIEEKFGELMLRSERYVTEVLAGNRTPDMIEDGFAPFAAATTLFKHQAFREENEVRIVAIPGTQQLSDRTKVEFPKRFIEKPIVDPIKLENAKGKIRRHIPLLRRSGQSLPLKRIIVCPGPDQDRQAAYAKGLTEIEIVKSGIPWTG